MATFRFMFESHTLEKKKKTVKVTFPENYQAADLAGAAVEFKCLVHEVKTKKVPKHQRAPLRK